MMSAVSRSPHPRYQMPHQVFRQQVIHPMTRQVIHQMPPQVFHQQVIHPISRQVIHPMSRQFIHPTPLQVIHPMSRQVIHPMSLQVFRLHFRLNPKCLLLSHPKFHQALLLFRTPHPTYHLRNHQALPPSR